MKRNAFTAAIAAAGGSKKRKIDIMDEYRPPIGIKYTLSQTILDYSAGYTNILGNYTVIEYEPGQDLSPQKPTIKYAKSRQRKPVWVFLEEQIRHKQTYKSYELAKQAAEKRKRRRKALRWLDEYMRSQQFK